MRGEGKIDLGQLYKAVGQKFTPHFYVWGQGESWIKQTLPCQKETGVISPLERGYNQQETRAIGCR